MARVKSGVQSRKRRKKVLKQAKGDFGAKHKLYRTAQEQVFNSLAYAYRDRKVRKRDFRKLWILRISAAVKAQGISYSRFICGLRKANIEINRKMLSEMAIHDAASFSKIVNTAKENFSN